MILRDNPVLLRELLVNLRSSRAFTLQFLYVAFLGVVVYFAWPAAGTLVSADLAQRLFDIFFLGQFFLVALVAPSFAAGSITGEKERKTYEMLLASPLKPTEILVGKLLSSLTYLVILIVSSLPLVILCFLLGGILLSEIARAYLILILAAGTFGLLSLACSSYFRRTSSALVVSYGTSSPSPSCRRGAWRSGRRWCSWSIVACSGRPTSAARGKRSSTRSRR
jgi:ABC-type transport system involved in multi-copper enzyme maturation permease subunit